MAIEIKQLVIKSTLIGERKEREQVGVAKADLDRLKQELMDACREMVERNLEETQER